MSIQRMNGNTISYQPQNQSSNRLTQADSQAVASQATARPVLDAIDRTNAVAAQGMASKFDVAGGGCGAIFSGDFMKQLVSLFQKLIQKLFQQLFQSLGTGGQQQNQTPGNSGGGGATPAAGGKGGIKVDGPNGFLFKPVSDSDKKLVILAPEKFKDKIANLVLKDANGNVVDKGSPKGHGEGNREFFRFKKPGAKYPPNLTVEFRLKDGTVKSYKIADPSQRYD